MQYKILLCKSFCYFNPSWYNLEIMNLSTISSNWVDLIILVFILLYLLERLGRGFIQGVIDVAGFVLSLIFSLKFYSIIAGLIMTYFSLSRGISNAIGFLLMALISEFVFYMIASYAFSFFDKDIIHSKANKVLGLIPTFLSALILSAFILTTVLVLPIRPDVKQYIVTSKLGGYLTNQTMGLERNLSDVFGDAVQESLTFLTVKPEGGDTINLNFKTKSYSSDDRAEQEMLALVNMERNKRGIKSVAPDSEMRIVAREHCRDMFERGYFSHYSPDGLSPFDRMNKAGIIYTVAGENLAYAPTIDIAHNGLMNSPGHKANILSVDYGRLGVGVIEAGIYGRMFCQEFRD